MRAIALMALGGGFALPTLASAQELAQAAAPTEVAAAEAAPEAAGDDIETVVVKARVNKEVNILSNEPVDSVFGFDKSIKDTPRSITSISNETLNKLNINELDDLVALSPGSFTQSFFGVAGSLDVRGTPGEVYFRGVRRIDNPGNYPTPIGASDRIDIVRGPASPIYGPSKIGGYLNFVPKSGRAEDGAYMKQPVGEFGVTRGSWDKDVIHGEVGGPGKIFGKDFGYYLYAETEDSGSYYQNTSTDQSIYQASIDMQLTEKSRIEFGGMYQNYEGNQVAGWNRVTQQLIDHGTYITGSPTSLDTNGDGRMSATESAAGNLAIFYPFGSSDPNVAFGDVSQQSASTVLADLAAHPNMALQNPGTAHINGSQVLVSPDDELTDEVTTLYFDFIHEFGNGLKMTNKSFYESLKNNNENAYGFSQFADTWVFEDQLIFSFAHDLGDWGKAAYQFSPSIRHQDFEHGDNFAYEYFDRRDITKPYTPASYRTLSTRDGSALEPYSTHTVGNYTDLGAALLADYTFLESIHLLGGARYDSVDVDSKCVEGVDCGGAGDPVIGKNYNSKDDAFSWSASLSYDIPMTGLTPYVTRAKQTTLIVGQGGEVPTSSVMAGKAVADSKLEEYGVKGSFWDDRLYFTLDYFKQERLDYSAQNTVTNNTTQSKGWEFEFRGVVTNNLAITAAYTNLKVYNLTAKENGNQFSFAGAGDLPAGVDPSLMFGGVINGLVLTDDGRKQGVPENIYSLYLIYNFDEHYGFLDGLTTTVGVTHVDSTYSGFSKAIELPSYTLWNAGLNYETKRWKLGLQGKNLTNEKYFRSNFPDLFGSSVVLPELPRNYLASVSYKF
ncbi:TonB-dependent receptor [Solimonas flava]|uniref:TonB-dependent siderophore receptor n=1 Tax=Solimonas flava TaxID=415849 RepID=UPI000A025993